MTEMVLREKLRPPTPEEWRGRVLASLWALIPRGRGLPDDVWCRRHRAVLVLLWAHVVAISAFGMLQGFGAPHSLFEASTVAGAAFLASWDRLGRTARAGFASLGLLTSSAVLVHLSGGYVEFHFHFFVMVALMALYQHWVPFLLAVGYVVIHHGVVGVLDPASVYNHPAALAHPWRWAAIHGAFITAASIVSLTAWRLNEYQALHDPLTKLANGMLLQDRLAHAAAVRRRHEHRVFAVLYLDLDAFKSINDTVGHATADRLLVALARRLETHVRPSDTIARLGGDEFAILLDDVADVSDAARVAERLICAVREPQTVDGKRFCVTASIGIAVADRQVDDAGELLRNADIAMYSAKARGKDRYEIFEPEMHAAAVRRLELEKDLQRAVESSEFVVHYQPIVSLPLGCIVGMEALVRWAHPQRGLVPPAEFIPVAEEIGLIGAIGRFVLESACRQARDWDDRHPSNPPWTMSVNLSGRQLQEPDLAAHVGRVLSETGLEPRRLTLEVTESAMLGETETAIARLGELKALGVQLSLDDFGTGYSSLTHLRRLPIDVLKIDRSFVNGIESERRNFDLLTSIVAVGATLHMRTVAEGVETPDQLTKLMTTGCDLVQGFHLARPLTPEGIDELLAHDGLHLPGAPGAPNGQPAVPAGGVRPVAAPR